MDELDRVLHRQDVIVARLVEEVHQRGQRRRFARSGRTADEHEPLVVVGDLREMRRQPQLDDRRRLFGDDAEDAVVAAMIVENVRPIAAALRNDVAEIDLMGLLQRAPLRRAHHFFQHGLGLLGSEGIALRAQQVGGQPHDRRLADREMKIRGALIPRGDQKRVEPRLALRAGDGQRRLADGVHLRHRFAVGQCKLVEDLDGVRTNAAILIILGHAGNGVEDLWMLEVLQRQHHLDAHVGRGVGKHFSEGREPARITDAPECLDGCPFDLGIGERRHQRLDSARILHPSERVGSGDSDPPVRIAQQLDRGRHDADIVEPRGDGDGTGADVGIGIV